MARGRGGVSYKELVKRFVEKVRGIPEECRPAVIVWYMARAVQRSRIALSNRMQQVEDGKKVFWAEVPDEFKALMVVDPEYKKQLEELEEEYVRRAEKLFRSTAWYNEVPVPAAEGVGMGPMIAGDLLWAIGTVSRFPTFGKLVAYAGLSVGPDGRAPRRKKGRKSRWNSKLRTALFKLSEVWWTNPKIADNPWKARWEAWEAWYAENRPGLTQAHVHNMARRRVQREFLRNLYTLWREYEERQRA